MGRKPKNIHKNTKPIVDLFTDGSCPKPFGPGGWAFILRIRITGKELKMSGGEEKTTNNRQELRSVLEGVKKLPIPCELHICSDSQYVVCGISKWRFGWKKKNWRKKNYDTKEWETVKNVDLWKELDILLESHEVHAYWVRGHDGHVENELCDKMAGLETKKIIEELGRIQNERRCFLIEKKNLGGGLTDEESTEFDVLQKLSREAMAKAFPVIPCVTPDELKIINDALAK